MIHQNSNASDLASMAIHATKAQLLGIIRDAEEFLDHTAICDVVTKWGALPPYPSCTCGMRLLMVRVEDALANHPERPESSDLPRRAIKVVNTGKDDGDDDGN